MARSKQPPGRLHLTLPDGEEMRCDFDVRTKGEAELKGALREGTGSPFRETE